VTESVTQKDVRFLSRTEIEARASDVLREHGLRTVPINPVILAKRLGMAVNNAKFSDEGVAGMIAKHGDEVMLLINREDPPYRKRFTIAHELGHHFLHLLADGEFVDGEENLFRQPKGDPNSWTPDQRREYQANMFAAALLMPEQAVRKAWGAQIALDQMARLFNVSEQAMGIRIDQLGLLDENKQN
jgi:Zn-dependent peptidase ImmA (M78 family)